MSGFDWEIMATCKYPVYSDMPGHRNDPKDCGEPACYRVWWVGDGSDSIPLCAEHFFKVRNDEYDPGDGPVAPIPEEA